MRERLPTKQQALDRATEIELDFKAQGTEGLALDAETRVMAVKGKARLEVVGKTIGEAVDYFEAYLKQEKAMAATATVENLTALWFAE